MTPNEFAKMIKAAHDCREASWHDGINWGTYGKSVQQAVDETVPAEWGTPVVVILISGYADIWDWAKEHGVTL